MSAANLKQWFLNLPIPWLVGRTNGIADGSAQGDVYDSEVSTLREAVKQRMPGLCADDALGHVGGDRVLIQGEFASESNDNFRTRMSYAYDAWGRAGQPAQLLYQLQAEGYTIADAGPVIVYQNGPYVTASGTIPVDADSADYVVFSELGTLGTALTSVNDHSYSVPADIPWWTTDSIPELCSRFFIIFTVNSFYLGIPSDNQLSRIKLLVDSWRPGEARCMGLIVLDSGYLFDWPVRTFTDMESFTFATYDGTAVVYPID